MRGGVLLAALVAAFVCSTPASQAAATCSASHLSTRVPRQSVSPAAAAMRQRIVTAAVACDYAQLQRLAGPRFTFDYGGGTSPAAYWRKLETHHTGRPLFMLVKILALPVTRNEAGAYAWPSAYTTHPKLADWNALVRAGVLTRAQADRQRKGGNVYYGYRTAITRGGDWQFFVQGD